MLMLPDRLLNILRLRLRSIFRRRTVERELEEELRSHLETRIAALEEQGLPAAEAKTTALREFGGVEQHKEACREARGLQLWENLLRDLGYAARTLFKNPAFALTAAVTIALGIGANTAIFTIAHGIFLKSLPFPEAERLVAVGETAPTGSLTAVPYRNYLDWRAEQNSFEEMAARMPAGGILTGEGDPERVFGRFVTASFFPTLRITPQIGRFFTEAEDTLGAEPVIILSDRLWQRRFGGSRSVIGRAIQYNGSNWTVIGVLPRDFDFYGRNNDNNEIFIPLGQLQQNDSTGRGYPVRITGRLKPGVNERAARTEIESLARRSALQYPEAAGPNPVSLTSFLADYTGEASKSVAVLSAAVALLLLIACANVANLTLARAINRQREIALRLALGASRFRVIRLLLAEAVVLALGGGVIGAMLAFWAVEAFKAAAPDSLPRLEDVHLNLPVLLAALGLTLLSGILSGLVPAWQMTRPNLDENLKAGGRQSSGGLTSQRWRNLLMVTELGLALLLLIGSGLLVQSFRNLMKDDRGYDPRQVLNFRLRLIDRKYPEGAQAIAVSREIQRRIAGLPGVKQVAAGTAIPLGRYVQDNYLVEGQPEPASLAQWPRCTSLSVSHGYHDVLGIKLLAGRLFTEHDRSDTPPVLIIDDQFARQNFAGASFSSILGRRLRFNGTGEPWREIVGVVAHVKYHHPEEEPLVETYRPWTQMSLRTWPADNSPEWLRAMDIVIKTSVDPMSILPAVRREVAAVDPDQPLGPVTTFETMLEKSMAPRQVNLTLVAIFSGAALLLSTVGLYGVMSYLVGQRRREIGVRLALGAQRQDVLRLVIGNGMTLALAGTVLGVAGAFALMRLLSSLLYGVSATDPAIYAAISLLLILVALFASYLPARRAANLNPVEALRYE